jgi:hypothetical protein
VEEEIDPVAASRAVKEYIATLNDVAFAAAHEVEPKFVSLPIRPRNGPVH